MKDVRSMVGSGVKYQAGEILVTSLEKRMTSNQEKTNTENV